MKRNEKQRAWAARNVAAGQSKYRRKMNYAFFGVIFIVALVMFVRGEASLLNFMSASGLSLAGVAPAAINIEGNASIAQSSGKQVKAKVWFIVEEQYDDTQAFPARAGRDVGNIPLKAGEFWHYIKTQSITNPDATIGGSLSDVGGTLTNELKLLLAGISDDTLELVEHHMGRGFYIVFEVCSTGKKYLGGGGCKPMVLQPPEGGFLNDKTSITLTFKNECGELFSNYVGNTPTAAPADIAAAVSFALTANPQYKFATDAASTLCKSVTAITDFDINRVVTVFGGGGAGPTKLVQDVAGNILLVAGAAWTGNLGSQISFKIFKDGAATYRLIEIAGTRT
jgi:hypothetical protein